MAAYNWLEHVGLLEIFLILREKVNTNSYVIIISYKIIRFDFEDNIINN